PRLRVGVHGLCEIRAAVGRHQARSIGSAGQAERLAGSAEPQLHLGADGDPREVTREGAGDVSGLAVAAIIAHGFAEQAGGDADPDLEAGRPPGGRAVGLARILHHAVLYRTCQPSTPAASRVCPLASSNDWAPPPPTPRGSRASSSSPTCAATTPTA